MVKSAGFANPSRRAAMLGRPSSRGKKWKNSMSAATIEASVAQLVALDAQLLLLADVLTHLLHEVGLDLLDQLGLAELLRVERVDVGDGEAAARLRDELDVVALGVGAAAGVKELHGEERPGAGGRSQLPTPPQRSIARNILLKVGGWGRNDDRDLRTI